MEAASLSSGITRLVALALVAVVVTAGFGYWLFAPPKMSREVASNTSASSQQTSLTPTTPALKREFEIQGLTWRTISYYYHPGIYREVYNLKDNVRFLTKARSVGGNYLLVRAFYNGTADGELVGNDAEAELSLREAIAMAHAHGMRVFLTPYIESAQFWPEKRWMLSEVEWTSVVLRWARFAEANAVEMFAPGVEMGLIMDADEAGEWFKTTLKMIRPIYSGRIAVAEHPYIGKWNVLDKHQAFAGYDCVGMTVFPWKQYDGSVDIRSIEDYEGDVKERARIITELATRYNTDCRFVATLGMDFWQGSEPNPTTRARGYQVALDILKEYSLTGVFLHIWASEHDHLGSSTEFENMLRRRWVQTESGHWQFSLNQNGGFSVSGKILVGFGLQSNCLIHSSYSVSVAKNIAGIRRFSLPHVNSSQ